MESELITNARLELHYYFKDSDSHSMDAIVRNECEKELLIIYKHVIEILDLDIKFESEAFTEGGLKEMWKFLGKHSAQLSLVISVLALVLSRVPLESTKLEDAKIENLNIDTELKREQLLQLKARTSNDDSLSMDTINELITILDGDYKITWHRSNFYRRLIHYSKVTQISTKSIGINKSPIQAEGEVNRSQFIEFIQKSDSFPTLIDEEALIDIISPVLKEKNYSWKGIYQGQAITFEMKDELFKKSVINNEVEFTNGTAIKCILHRFRKIDDKGNIIFSKNQVSLVIEVTSDSLLSETTQGAKHKRNKKQSDKQLRLGL